MKKIMTLLLIMLFSGTALAQESFSSVEERMTGREFKDTGLDKLSEEELTALNKWLRDHSVATLETRTVQPVTVAPQSGQSSASSAAATASSSEAAPAGDRRGFEGRITDASTVESRIVGEFSGWDGETIFTLENGMVWKQAQTDKYYTKTLINPGVKIKSAMWGSWRMTVEGYNKSVKVERIQ
jgi:hypothetical protein